MIETDDCECTVIHEDVVVEVRKQMPLPNQKLLRPPTAQTSLRWRQDANAERM
jgi:hypothetical protein